MSNNQQQQFEISISKIRAINKINVEIWNRIVERKRFRRFEIPQIDRVVFRDSCLEIITTVKIIPLPDLESCFDDVDNIFNSTIPTNEYFDMSEVIEKYSCLNPTKVENIFEEWKTALELVQTKLGEVEQKIVDAEADSEKVIFFFIIS